MFKIEDTVGIVMKLGIFFLTCFSFFVIFILLHICQYYVYFGEFLAMSILWDGDQKGLASC